MKISSNDIVAILRRFELANDDTRPRDIEQMNISRPREHTIVVAFRFQRQFYYVLLDQSVDNDATQVLERIHEYRPDVDGGVIAHQLATPETYGISFKGKMTYVLKAASHSMRLDQLLAARHPELSRSTWQKHIAAGHIHVNGAPAKSSKQDVRDADAIDITLPEASDYSSFDLPILYLDDNVIVINKPAGILTHAKGAVNEEFTVADFFRRYTTHALDTNRPGIVHRLDRDTSGVMIGARNDEAALLLKKQFSDRNVAKTYVAVLAGIPKERKANIDIPIERNPSSPSTFRAAASGKPARTAYEISAINEQNESYATLRPLTGRTHQLRVHMQFLGTPIVGDRVYGKANERLFLHAHSLEITIPQSTRKTFNAPIPADFTARFNQSDMIDS